MICFWMVCSLQYRFSCNLCFFIWYVVFLHIKAGTHSVMCSKIRTMPWLPKMQHQQPLRLYWRSYSWCSRERVAVGFAPKGCQYLNNGCLQPMGTQISQGAMLRIFDTPLTLILKMGQWLYWFLFCQWKLPIRHLCITAMKNPLQLPYLQDQKLFMLHWHSFQCMVHSISATIESCFHDDFHSIVVFLADSDWALWQSHVQ